MRRYSQEVSRGDDWNQQLSSRDGEEWQVSRSHGGVQLLKDLSTKQQVSQSHKHQLPYYGKRIHSLVFINTEQISLSRSHTEQQTKWYKIQ